MKKNMIPAAMIAASLLLLLPGCKRESKTMIPTGTGKPVRFSTIIKTTRAYNNMWEEGDLIGVYMLPSVAGNIFTANGSSADPLAENKLYSHETGDESESVIFEGIDEENTIFWPGDDRAMDFVAYYPWRPSEDIPEDIYPVDISDQSVPQEIDLMYSCNAKGVRSGNPALNFEHKLSSVVFNVVDVDGIALDGMRIVIEGLPTSAGFNLRTGEMIADDEAATDPFDALLFSTTDTDDDEIRESAVATAIVLPGENMEYTVRFILTNGDEAVFGLDGDSYEKGKRYIYDINLFSEPGEEVGFGFDGELSTITDWEDVINEEPHDIIKNHDGLSGNNLPSDGETGETWSSGALMSDVDGTMYTVSGDYREIEGGCEVAKEKEMVIGKTNYGGGIISVTMNMKCTPRNAARIESIRVGDASLFYEGETSVNILGSGFEMTEASYTFTTADGEAVFGEIEIIIRGTVGSPVVTGFTIN